MGVVFCMQVLFLCFQFIDTASSTAFAAASSAPSDGAASGPAAKKAPADGIVREYCEWETFDASCNPDEVIVITRALYGRPNVGRCVKPAYGHVGCFSDVRPLADALCSGRQQCQITVPDKIFEGMIPCREDLKLHLEIGYTCVKVLLPIDKNCRNTLPASSVTPASPGSSTARPVSVTGGTARGVDGVIGAGVLASFFTSVNGCGSPGNPWLINVGPGQRVNVSLIDFSLTGVGGGNGNGSGMASSGHRGGSGLGRNQAGLPYCQVYAIIKEQGGQQGVTVCSSEGVHGGSTTERERPVYLSTTNAVEIRILTTRSTKDSTGGYFMLRYQPVGCADVETPSNVWWKRDGDNATSGCRTPGGQSTHQRVWHSTCVGNTWMGDFPGNCPDVASTSGSAWPSTTHSVTATLIILIASLVGLAVFAAGFCVIHRRCYLAMRKAPYESTTVVANARPILSKDDAKSMTETYGRSTSTKYDARSTYHTAGGLRPYAPTTTQATHYMSRAAESSFDDTCCGSAVDNEYAYVDEVYGSHGYTTCTGVAPPPPPANNNVGIRSAATVAVSSTGVRTDLPPPQQQLQHDGVDPVTGVCYQYNFNADGRLPVDEVDCGRDADVMYWQRQQRQYHHQQQQQQHQLLLQQQQVVVGSLPRHHHFVA